MKKTRQTLKLLAAVAAVAALTAGCTTVSNGVADNGESAQELRWPEMNSTNAVHTGGIFPNIQSLQLVQAGMNKQQIADLIGAPQYGEFMGTREWNYLLNFRSANGQVTQCQYKVLFDTKKLARSFYWNPEGCAAPFLNPVAAPAPKAEQVNLSADALFAFDKADLAHVKPQGRKELNALAQALTGAAGQGVKAVDVVGYTDRLGTPAYNMRLSQERATTVRSYLVAHGVPAQLITAEGRGEADPVVQCQESGRQALIACLAPNRRVTVNVQR